MYSNIFKTKIMACMFISVLLILSCNNKTDIENQIAIKINSIDSKTKEPRVNMFDTIEVRKEGASWCLIKSFDKVGEYVTDSKGSVNVNIDSSKIYDISVSGLNVVGGDMYFPGFLKDGQEVNIEVISLENR